MTHDPRLDAATELASPRRLGRASAADFAPGRCDALCITLYNEPLAELLLSLRAVARSAHELARRGGRRALCVCLVIDGVDRMDREVLDFLVREGYALEPQPADATAPAEVFHSVHPLGEWLEEAAACERAPALRFVTCLKPRNRGKLHSHALFFGALCPTLDPTVCIQVDAGTAIAPAALPALIEHLERHPHVGAVGTQVRFERPGPADGLLQRWQYMDWAAQLATYAPAELLSGHLSVIPGPFCALRWRALSERMPGSDAPNPIGRYLRGLSPCSPMEGVMFLAEDRVIGNEIVLAAGTPWRLDSCQEAEAVTDACKDFGELRRQRRRWNNCSLACRLWLLAQWPGLLRRTDRSGADKLRYSTAMVWQALLCVLQAATPAIALCTLGLVVGTLWVAAQSGHAGWALASAAALLVAVPLMLRTPGAHAARRLGARTEGHGLAARGARRYAALRDVAAATAVGLLVLTALQLLPAAAVALLFAPTALLAAMPALTAPKRRWSALRHVPEFMLLNAPVQSLLWLYALLRLGDLSWGTKGLVATADSTRVRAGCYRRCVAVALPALNVGLLAWAIGGRGLWGAPSNPVAEAFGMAVALVITMALGGWLRMACTWLAMRLARPWVLPHELSAPETEHV